ALGPGRARARRSARPSAAGGDRRHERAGRRGPPAARGRRRVRGAPARRPGGRRPDRRRPAAHHRRRTSPRRGRGGMKITDATVIVTSPGRNYVTVKITTEDGIVGYGDGTLNGRELAVAAYLQEHVVPLLIGRDARRINDTWQYLYRGGYWRRGPVTMTAIGAVDTALWDILGKAANMPVYRLLGGASRERVLVYGHASGADVEETVAAVARYANEGYTAIRAQSGIPGIGTTYGVGRAGHHYEPAEKGLPPEAVWSTEKYLA